MDSLPAMVIVCRRPVLGVGKQRLASTLGATTARDIGLGLLDCALEDAASWRGPVVLAPADACDVQWAAGLLARKTLVLPQATGNLGVRLQQLDCDARALGLQQLLFIGSDAPAHDKALYDAAAFGLRHADVVLAPALDGGVTLMGARHAWPELADLPWSTAALSAALQQRCGKSGMSLSTLADSFDVDEVADLHRAAAALASDPRPARRALCALLQSLRLQQAL